MAATPEKKTTKTNAKAKAPKKEPAKPRSPRRRVPSHDAIAKRAYELSVEGREGDSISHWLEAERELKGS